MAIKFLLNRFRSKTFPFDPNLAHPVGCDILLIKLPPWGVEYPPLGIAFLSTFLKSRGLNPGVLDLNAEMFSEAEKADKSLWDMGYYESWTNSKDYQGSIAPRLYPTMKRWAEKIISIEPKSIGFSTTIASVHFANSFAKILRELGPDTPIIVGGPGCFYADHRLMFDLDQFDLFVTGEGEETLAELVDHILKDEPLENIKGAIVSSEEQARIELPRRSLANLEQLPYPTYEEFDMTLYTTEQLGLQMSRGCVRRCSYCNDHKMQGRFRIRPPEQIVEEIARHKKHHGTRSFSFCDLLINGNVKKLECFCRLLEKQFSRGLRVLQRVRWGGQAIVRKGMTYDLLYLMRRSGCDTLVLGIESLSDKVLKAMNKPYNGEEASDAVRMVREAGIKTAINLIIGFPGESDVEFNETCNRLEKLGPYISRVSSLNTCQINSDTYIKEKMFEWGITWDSDMDGALKWYTHDGNNTYSIRCQRVLKIRSLLDKLKIPYTCVVPPEKAYRSLTFKE